MEQDNEKPRPEYTNPLINQEIPPGIQPVYYNQINNNSENLNEAPIPVNNQDSNDSVPLPSAPESSAKDPSNIQNPFLQPVVYNQGKRKLHQADIDFTNQLIKELNEIKLPKPTETPDYEEYFFWGSCMAIFVIVFGCIFAVLGLIIISIMGAHIPPFFALIPLFLLFMYFFFGCLSYGCKVIYFKESRIIRISSKYFLWCCCPCRRTEFYLDTISHTVLEWSRYDAGDAGEQEDYLVNVFINNNEIVLPATKGLMDSKYVHMGIKVILDDLIVKYKNNPNNNAVTDLGV